MADEKSGPKDSRPPMRRSPFVKGHARRHDQGVQVLLASRLRKLVFKHLTMVSQLIHLAHNSRISRSAYSQDHMQQIDTLGIFLWY